MPLIEKTFEILEIQLEERKEIRSYENMNKSVLRLVLPVALGSCFILVLVLIFLCKKYQKSTESQSPPEYEPNYPNFSPPDYETAVAPENPPPYSYENVTFENDPPPYNSIVVTTTRTVVYQ